MLIVVDMDTFCHYAFRVKFAKKPFSDGVIRDSKIQKMLDKIYKSKVNEAVLYLGKNCNNCVLHFNMIDFLLTMDIYKNVEITLNNMLLKA